MGYNILGINPNHNGSTVLISDGKLVYYTEEERLSRIKYDGDPFLGMFYILNKYPIDHFVVAGTRDEFPKLEYSAYDPYAGLFSKLNKQGEISYLGHQHHRLHASCAFYNSGFKTAVSVIIDGAGTYREVEINQDIHIEGFEAESIFHCAYPTEITQLHQSLVNNKTPYAEFEGYTVGSHMTLTKCYEAVTHYLGFKFLECGKTMGLSSYGKENTKLPKLLNSNKRGSKEIFIDFIPSGAFIDQSTHSIFRKKQSSYEWHRDFNKATSLEKDIAYSIQKETQEAVGDYIQKAIDLTKENNVVVAGGYGLNCVTNYYLTKRFPKINFYFEPISHDGGTAIGAAKYCYYEKTGSTTPIPQKSIYYGKKYSKKKILKTIEKYV